MKLGVTPLVGQTVVDVHASDVAIRASPGWSRRCPPAPAVWAAGVTASPLPAMLAEAANIDVDRAGRVPVGPD